MRSIRLDIDYVPFLVFTNKDEVKVNKNEKKKPEIVILSTKLVDEYKRSKKTLKNLLVSPKILSIWVAIQ